MSEEKKPNPIEVVNSIINHSRSVGLVHRVDEGASHSGRTVTLDGKTLVNLGSCGYMGLEFDPRVKQAAIAAIESHGITTGCSRTYLSNPNYPLLEELLEKILLRPTVLAPTTTLLHLAALPILVGEDDLVLLDQQVHNSVQLTAKVLKANGAQVEIVPHNGLERVERRIKAHQVKGNVWYLGDGVYSMYGDFAPVGGLETLLDKYANFHVYLDDAHGMSWTGPRGTGFVLGNMKHHDRLYVAIGLYKGFGTGGGALACPNKDVKQLVRNCGATQFFASPIQPPVLAAAVASATIHLEPDFGQKQNELMDRIHAMDKVLEKQPLPVMSAPDSPIRFVGVGEAEPAEAILKTLIQEGFWLNIARYPAVPPRHTGMRFMLTRQIQFKDIELFGDALKYAVEKVMGKDEESLAQIWKNFRKEYRYSLING